MLAAGAGRNSAFFRAKCSKLKADSSYSVKVFVSARISRTWILRDKQCYCPHLEKLRCLQSIQNHTGQRKRTVITAYTPVALINCNCRLPKGRLKRRPQSALIAFCSHRFAFNGPFLKTSDTYLFSCRRLASETQAASSSRDSPYSLPPPPGRIRTSSSGHLEISPDKAPEPSTLLSPPVPHNGHTVSRNPSLPLLDPG